MTGEGIGYPIVAEEITPEESWFTGTVDRTSLVSDVNREMENLPRMGEATATGDGHSLSYQIAPIGRTVLSDGFLMYVDTVLTDPTTLGTMDFDTGVYTFTVAPAALAELKWPFTHVYWTDEQVVYSINVAVGALFPSIYASGQEQIVTDGSGYEYPLSAARVAAVTAVGLSADGAPPFRSIRASKRDFYRRGDKWVLRFFTPPQAGTLRVQYVAPPAPLSDPDDTLDVGDRAVPPIISYACYHLLIQKMAPRLRSDVAANVTGQGNLSPRQMNDAANTYFFRYTVQLKSAKMNPWAIK